jgi:hypothetical protein
MAWENNASRAAVVSACSLWPSRKTQFRSVFLSRFESLRALDRTTHLQNIDNMKQIGCQSEIALVHYNLSPFAPVARLKAASRCTTSNCITAEKPGKVLRAFSGPLFELATRHDNRCG